MRSASVCCALSAAPRSEARYTRQRPRAAKRVFPALVLGYIGLMKPAQNSREKAVKSRAAGAAAKRTNHSGRFPELSSLSEADLAELIARAEQELSRRRDRKRAEFFVSIREQAQALGVAPEELVAALSRKQDRAPAPDRRSKVAPKYRNPAKPS